jgi:hypothetical protein
VGAGEEGVYEGVWRVLMICWTLKGRQNVKDLENYEYGRAKSLKPPARLRPWYNISVISNPKAELRDPMWEGIVIPILRRVYSTI